MKSKKSIWCILIIATISLLFFGISIGADNSQKYLEKFKAVEPAEPLLAPDIQVESGFTPGKGIQIGHIQKIQGKVYVIHNGEKVAYVLKKNPPLFTGDTLITEKRSRVNAVMNDKSVLALAPISKLIINKSVYDPEKNARSSLMSVLWGQARFIVEKIAGKPDFRVKTQTAVCGVRGSDFAVSVAPVGEETASIQKFLTEIFLVREAHALVPGALITTVLTGPGSTVGLTGAIGGTTVIGPASVAGVIGGAAAGGATVIGATAAAGVLGSIGPGLATLSMPPEYE